MSVLIKGMEMPPNCSECAFCGYYGNKTHLCDINQQEIDYEAMLENCRDDCPLVEIPPHGRLIDADALQKDIQKHADLFVNCGNLDLAAMAQRDGLSCALSDVVNAPTIIEAEDD